MFQITIKETKEFLRDRINLFFFIMFPVVLVFLLGSLLKSMDKAEEAVGEIKLHYLVTTENPVNIMTIEGFIQSIGDNQNLIFEQTENLEASKQLAGNNEITAVIEFTGNPFSINIYEGSNQIANRTVAAIMNGFKQSNKSISAVMKTLPETLQDIDQTERSEFILQKDLGVNRTMMDYYAVAMLAMISFMSALVGAGAFVGERQNKTINRLIAAPKNRISLFLQKVFGMIPQVIIQLSVLMLISVFVFKAHYAATLLVNLYLFFMFFMVTLCMISVGAVIGIFIKVNPSAVIMPVLWIMMFLGGTYSKEMYIKGLTDKMPSFQIQQAAFDLAIFERFDKANTVIITCIIIMSIALAIGAFLFSRKEEER
ncbi:MAG: type transporter [Herbinix sp.]|nr:type transporter [Herbinix sp.]